MLISSHRTGYHELAQAVPESTDMSAHHCIEFLCGLSSLGQFEDSASQALCNCCIKYIDNCDLQTWESKAKQAGSERDTALKQAADLQEQLDSQGSNAEHISQAVRGLEQRNTAMQRQMAVKVASHLQHV